MERTFFDLWPPLAELPPRPDFFDLHCHYLPGVDDGPRTLDEALDLARAAVADGIKAAVLTPHIHPGVYDNALTALLPHFIDFQRALSAAHIPLETRLGAEVRLGPDTFELLDRAEVPFIAQQGPDRYLLTEFPDGSIPPGALHACRLLQLRGVTPIIAHPERNKEVMRDPSRMIPFARSGCLLQLTAGSIIGEFGPAALKTATTLLENGMTTLIATDAHNLRHRPPRLSAAWSTLAERYGAAFAKRLTHDNPSGLYRRNRL